MNLGFSFPNLTVLNLPNNLLVGPIPSSIGLSNQLIYLDLEQNMLTSTIPPILGYLENLLLFNLYSNKLTGSIPSSVCHLRRAVSFAVYRNKLTGSLPSCLGSLLNMTQFQTHSNRISGRLPSSIGEMLALEVLMIHDNLMTGLLPSSLSKLKNLRNLNVGFNSFEGFIEQVMWTNLNQLKRLLIDNNFFSGTFDLNPLGLVGVLTNLSLIDCSHNAFDGYVAASSFNLPSLVSFSAVANCFKGRLPMEICNSTLLQTLALDGLTSGAKCLFIFLIIFISAFDF